MGTGAAQDRGGERAGGRQSRHREGRGRRRGLGDDRYRSPFHDRAALSTSKKNDGPPDEASGAPYPK